jgi:hypothetical protein
MLPRDNRRPPAASETPARRESTMPSGLRPPDARSFVPAPGGIDRDNRPHDRRLDVHSHGASPQVFEVCSNPGNACNRLQYNQTCQFNNFQAVVRLWSAAPAGHPLSSTSSQDPRTGKVPDAVAMRE